MYVFNGFEHAATVISAMRNCAEYKEVVMVDELLRAARKKANEMKDVPLSQRIRKSS